MAVPWLPVAFALCLVAVGLPFWLTPYSQLSLPDALILPGLLVVVPLAAGLRFFAIARSATIAAVLVGAMLLANIVRIAVDTSIDPTSHNLFPFELAITLIYGAAFALGGSLVGKLANALVLRSGGDGGGP